MYIYKYNKHKYAVGPSNWAYIGRGGPNINNQVVKYVPFIHKQDKVLFLKWVVVKLLKLLHSPGFTGTRSAQGRVGVR